MGKIIGIDLGTTNSVVAVSEGKTPRVIADAEGRKTVPSVVAASPAGERLVGHRAKHQAAANPLQTVYSIKRFMGLRPAEAIDEIRRVPYKVEPRGVDDLVVRLGDEALTPPEVSARVLRHLKEIAEADLGAAVDRAVVTVPAYFNDAQRQATRKAGQLAGLTVERIVNEPTAAALAYGLENQKNGVVAVYDLGGGTFDVTILEIVDGVFEVRSTAGDTHLGGDDLDHRIMDWVVERTRTAHGVDLAADPHELQRLREAAERAKCDLSTVEATEIVLPFVRGGGAKTVNVKEVLTREGFEELVADLIDRTRAPCLQALRDAALAPGDIDEVILVGGSTRIPRVRALVEEIFGRAPHTEIDPDLAVGLGAAIQGGILAGDPFGTILLDVTPLSLGLETVGGIMTKLISRNTTIPTSHREMFTTFVDNQTSVDIHVLQGERELAKDNRTLGRFALAGLPPMPAGAPQIEITFNLDQNGILQVSATEMRTGAEAAIELKASADISDEEVDRMVREAIAKGKEDRDKAGLIEARNRAEQIVRSVRKALDDPELVPEGAERFELIEAIEAVEAALAGGVERAIREATGHLDRIAEPVADRMMERIAAARVAEGRED